MLRYLKEELHEKTSSTNTCMHALTFTPMMHGCSDEHPMTRKRRKPIKSKKYQKRKQKNTQETKPKTKKQ